MTLFTDGGAKRQCIVCGRSFRPRVPDIVVCSPWCRNERNKHKQRSARHYWSAKGKPPVNDADVDLRIGRRWASR
jgi:predicted nucleic acid-binding Zn ribbon protein